VALSPAFSTLFFVVLFLINSTNHFASNGISIASLREKEFSFSSNIGK
jgi:hypothetical protein